MQKLVALAIAVVLAALVGASVTFGQEGGEATPAEIEAEFGGLSRADIVAMGYAVEEECISAEAVGAPAALGAMGFHAVNESLIDGVVDPLEPEAVLLNADDEVIAVEYIAAPNSGLSVLGQDLVFVPPIGHDALHMWFLENPAGQFADFNPAVSCPEVVSIASTGTGGYVTDSGSGTATLLIVLASIVGAGLVGAGLTLRRRTSH